MFRSIREIDQTTGNQRLILSLFFENHFPAFILQLLINETNVRMFLGIEKEILLLCFSSVATLRTKVEMNNNAIALL